MSCIIASDFGLFPISGFEVLGSRAKSATNRKIYFSFTHATSKLSQPAIGISVPFQDDANIQPENTEIITS